MCNRQLACSGVYEAVRIRQQGACCLAFFTFFFYFTFFTFFSLFFTFFHFFSLFSLFSLFIFCTTIGFPHRFKHHEFIQRYWMAAPDIVRGFDYSKKNNHVSEVARPIAQGIVDVLGERECWEKKKKRRNKKIFFFFLFFFSFSVDTCSLLT